MPDVVTSGETMLLGVPPRPGRLRHSHSLELRIGGAESNVAIALARLGVSAGWVSCLSDDETGQTVLDRIRAEGVDTSRVRRLRDSPTGLYLRENLATGVRAYYYRSDSAASRMAPGGFDPEYLRGAKFLHLTGITPALSDSCAEFVRWAAREARGRGARLSFDINYRAKLWKPEAAREFVEGLLPEVDLLFVGDEEARALWKSGDEEELVRSLASSGPREVVLKRGKGGSLALFEGRVMAHDAFTVTEVDPVGAGDAFDAGYLAGYIWGLPPAERLRVANAMGALSVAAPGDYEGLPLRDELMDFLQGKKMLGR